MPTVLYCNRMLIFVNAQNNKFGLELTLFREKKILNSAETSYPAY